MNMSVKTLLELFLEQLAHLTLSPLMAHLVWFPALSKISYLTIICIKQLAIKWRVAHDTSKRDKASNPSGRNYLDALLV